MRAVALLLSAGGALGCAPEAQSSANPDAGANAARSEDAGDGADAGDDARAPGGYSLSSFPGGTDDRFSMPPAFAPFLPLSGEGATREPPGMYDPGSGEFFSYVALWWLEGSPALTTAALESYLGVYYAGLCGSASATLGEPQSDSLRSGILEVTRCFDWATTAPNLEVLTRPCPSHDAVVILVSPEPANATVWRTLREIRESFVCW